MPLLKILQWFPTYPRIKSNLPESALPRTHPISPPPPLAHQDSQDTGELVPPWGSWLCSSSIRAAPFHPWPLSSNVSCPMLPASRTALFLSTLSNHIPLLHVMEQISIHSGDLLPDLAVCLCPFWNASPPQGPGGVPLASSFLSVV